ncbi:MAG: hypothetical protein JW869_06180 [Candidatus Omnitrophica bacterium]|nr:hypothetical protein [Candidatus Omnitrophota bacterium]
MVVVGVFFCQTNTFALTYGNHELLQDFDNGNKSGAIGLACTVAMAGVPIVADGNIFVGAALGAGIGATPGLIEGNGTAALIGGGLGAFSGGFSTHGYNVGGGSADKMGYFASSFGISVASQNASQLVTNLAVHEWGMNPTGAQALGMIAGSTAGWSLTGTTDWGKEMMQNMYAKNQGLSNLAKTNGPLAGAITGLGMGALQAGATIGLDKALDGNVPDSVRSDIAGLGGRALGSIAWGGIVGGLGQKGMREKMAEVGQQTKIEGQTMEQEGWDQIDTARTWEIMEGQDSMGTSNNDVNMKGPLEYEHLSLPENQNIPLFGESEVDKTVLEGFFAPKLANLDPSAVGQSDLTNTAVLQAGLDKGYIALAQEGVRNVQDGKAFQVMGDAAIAKAQTYNGVWEGMKGVVNKEFRKNLMRESLAIGLTWAIDENTDLGPQNASAIGSAGSMFLANMPIWGKSAESRAKNKIQDAYKTGQEALDRLNADKDMLVKQIPFEENGKPLIENRIELLEETMDFYGNILDVKTSDSARLRDPSVITNNPNIDAVLEPVIYAATAYAMNELGSGKTGADLAAHNLATMQLATITHAGIAALANGPRNFKEFGQDFMNTGADKMDDFYGDVYSFGNTSYKNAYKGQEAQAKEKNNYAGGNHIFGAASMNAQLWSFAGLDGLAINAKKYLKEGADWRSGVTSQMPSNAFTAYTNRISGVAKSHTVRNLEGLSYTVYKNVAPEAWRPDGERVDPYLYGQLNEDQRNAFNILIQRSYYPPSQVKPGNVRFPRTTVLFEAATQKVLLEDRKSGGKCKFDSKITDIKNYDFNVNMPNIPNSNNLPNLNVPNMPVVDKK